MIFKNNNNPKKTWKIVNDVLTQERRCDFLPSEMQYISENNDASKSMVDRFNKFFTQVGETLKENIDKNDTDPFEHVADATDEMTYLCQVSGNDFEQIILHLTDVGACIDGINGKILKCTHKLFLSKLIYQSLPRNILPVISKIFEKKINIIRCDNSYQKATL